MMKRNDLKPSLHNAHEVPFRWWIAAVVSVLVLWAGSALLIVIHADAETTLLGNQGTFGDMFGAVNALFSGLAFATLIYTVFQQRAELSATRAEMRQQSREWERQNAVLSLQAFEGSFFQMLQMLEAAASSAFIKHEKIMSPSFSDKHVGDDAFQLMIHEIKELWVFAQMSNQYEGAPELKIMRNMVSEALKKHGVGFFRYVEALTNVTAFIASSHVDDKKIYARLLRSQMSNEQLSFVFYVAFGQDVETTLRGSLDQLNFFDGVPDELFIQRGHMGIYNDAEVARR